MIRHLSKLLTMVAIFFVISGAAAYFTVSYIVQHEKTLIVPDLRGQDLVNVLTLLGNFGLNARIKGADYSDAIPKNHVMGQDPKPGDVIKTGRDVRLTISKGMRFLAMPDLKGLNLQQARLIQEKNGLVSGTESKTFHERVKQDTIISQYPPAGREIEQGSSVDLLISRGAMPRAIVMPDLTGLFLDEAVVAAEKNHLVVEEIKPVYIKTKPINVILNQDPPPGQHVVDGEVIHLSVNRKSSSINGNAGFGEKRNPLFRYQSPPGYLKQHIRVELMAFGATWMLYDELMDPDREIWIVVPELSMSVIFLYKNNELIITKIYD